MHFMHASLITGEVPVNAYTVLLIESDPFAELSGCPLRPIHFLSLYRASTLRGSL